MALRTVDGGSEADLDLRAITDEHDIVDLNELEADGTHDAGLGDPRSTSERDTEELHYEPESRQFLNGGAKLPEGSALGEESYGECDRSPSRNGRCGHLVILESHPPAESPRQSSSRSGSADTAMPILTRADSGSTVFSRPVNSRQRRNRLRRAVALPGSRVAAFAAFALIVAGITVVALNAAGGLNPSRRTPQTQAHSATGSATSTQSGTPSQFHRVVRTGPADEARRTSTRAGTATHHHRLHRNSHTSRTTEPVSHTSSLISEGDQHPSSSAGTGSSQAPVQTSTSAPVEHTSTEAPVQQSPPQEPATSQSSGTGQSSAAQSQPSAQPAGPSGLGTQVGGNCDPKCT
jgi:hypothetical protein